jgi:transcriptional regulator with XRE-family HTH domain
MTTLESQREHIAERVRELRRGRRWTQAELAKQLELSQSRLSEIESGNGSFTAEQLLRVLALFNVGVEHFVEHRNDPQLELQNALARFGAKHLVESDAVVPTERLSEVSNAIREALLDGSPRLVTAVAPVLVSHARQLNLYALLAELTRLGRERRLGWAIESTLEALRKLVKGPDSAFWNKQLLGAGLALELNAPLVFTSMKKGERSTYSHDVLDPSIRTLASLDKARHDSSALAKKWGVVTAISTEDFVNALREAR